MMIVCLSVTMIVDSAETRRNSEQWECPTPRNEDCLHSPACQLVSLCNLSYLLHLVLLFVQYRLRKCLVINHLTMRSEIYNLFF